MNDIEEAIYPELSICFVAPFIKNDDVGITKNDTFRFLYQKYLRGNGSNALFKGMGYKEVTPDLFDYFEDLYIDHQYQNVSHKITDCRSFF